MKTKTRPGPVAGSITGAWWQSFYEDTPFELYLKRTDAAEVAATIAFLRDKLQVADGARLFDQCCGLGGMSIPLAEAGFDVVAVDLCHKYIDMARAAVADTALKADFHQGDAFVFLPPGKNDVDGAFNWYTSFGYSEDDDVNARMISRAFEALKPGARFALDFLNMPMIMQSFKKTMACTLAGDGGAILQERECSLDVAKGTMLQNWTWTLPDGKVLKQASTLRAYMPCDLVRMFKQCGFTEVELFGDIQGGPLTVDSGRCIILGRKPI
jgi:2-polyprenyl-3-methyl-5-hydroxy-6-metoxy-1,4-benzoquinol methylase